MKNKIFKGVAIVLIAVVLLIMLVLSGFSLGERIMFWSFYASSERYEKIPGLWDQFVPQGYNQYDKTARFAVGYMSDGSASRVYILRDGADAEYIELLNEDGSPYTGHTGGIDVFYSYVYITGDKGCDIFSLDDILSGKNAKKIGEVKTVNDPAYCVIKDGILYSGSFYRAENYETPTEHRFTTPAGDENTALIAAYKLDPKTGLSYSEQPECVISTTGLVQGMTFIDDQTVALSTSYGLAKSHLLIYDLDKLECDTDGFKTEDANIPLYYLDSSCLKEDIIAPPMAEQIFFKDGYIYIMTESASMKYLFGKLTSGNYVYGYKYN